MPNKRLLAALGVTAALAAGAVAAVVVGAPGVSGAQTSDAPTTTTPSTTEAPANRDGNCPHMGDRSGQAPDGSPSGATSTGFRARGGLRQL